MSNDCFSLSLLAWDSEQISVSNFVQPSYRSSKALAVPQQRTVVGPQRERSTSAPNVCLVNPGDTASLEVPAVWCCLYTVFSFCMVC